MPVKPTKAWKEVPGTQVTEDSLWEITKNYTSYLTSNHDLTLSTDPLNLTGLNTKRDSGVAAVRAIGISFDAKERTVKVKKAKKKAQVYRVNLKLKTKKQIPKKNLVAVKDGKPQHNHLVYSERPNITVRAVVKSLKRDLKSYRPDLIHLALKKLYTIHVFKKNNKIKNIQDAKAIKA